jgi:hypothetical protein
MESPKSVAVKLSNAQYRRYPLKGGEEFRVSTAYAGKKGDVIIVFTPKSPITEYKFMELPLNDAITSLDVRFKELMKDLHNNGYKVTDLQEKTVGSINIQHREKLMEDPRYGAW